jgi:hypothetical protein
MNARAERWPSGRHALPTRWRGNLAIFYQASGYASGLVKLGSIGSGVEALANQQGSFTVTIDRAG